MHCVKQFVSIIIWGFSPNITIIYVNYFIKAIIFFSHWHLGIYITFYMFLYLFILSANIRKKIQNTGLRIRYRFLFRFVRLFASIYDISISCLFFITISNVSRETFNIIIFHRQTSFSSAYPVTAPATFLPSSVLRHFT